jgi:DNA-binding response OmpR family regulator
MSNKTVLVVEDDADVRLGFDVLLKAHHYDVLFAADALSAVKEAGTRQPDLIILDLGLPTGDGFILLERFQAMPTLTAIPVIVVSGRDVRGNKERALKAGAKAFLQKPWNDEELLAIVGELLDEPELSAPLSE